MSKIPGIGIGNPSRIFHRIQTVLNLFDAQIGIRQVLLHLKQLCHLGRFLVDASQRNARLIQIRNFDISNTRQIGHVALFQQFQTRVIRPRRYIRSPPRLIAFVCWHRQRWIRIAQIPLGFRQSLRRIHRKFRHHIGRGNLLRTANHHVYFGSLFHTLQHNGILGRINQCVGVLHRVGFFLLPPTGDG